MKVVRGIDGSPSFLHRPSDVNGRNLPSKEEQASNSLLCVQLFLLLDLGERNSQLRQGTILGFSQYSVVCVYVCDVGLVLVWLAY